VATVNRQAVQLIEKALFATKPRRLDPGLFLSIRRAHPLAPRSLSVDCSGYGSESQAPNRPKGLRRSERFRIVPVE
jgi:hypothetical protein